MAGKKGKVLVSLVKMKGCVSAGPPLETHKYYCTITKDQNHLLKWVLLLLTSFGKFSLFLIKQRNNWKYKFKTEQKETD